jgi:RHS repeat-associated protein
MNTPFLYNGMFGVMTDSNGLICMRARYYSPYLMRFLNADPSGFSGGSNWFCYANGNPVSALDPLGLESYFGKDELNALSGATGLSATPGYEKLPALTTGERLGDLANNLGIYFFGGGFGIQYTSPNARAKGYDMAQTEAIMIQAEGDYLMLWAGKGEMSKVEPIRTFSEPLYHSSTNASINNIMTNGLNEQAARNPQIGYANAKEGFWLSPYTDAGYGESMIQIELNKVEQYLIPRQGAIGEQEFLLPFEHFNSISPSDFTRVTGGGKKGG